MENKSFITATLLLACSSWGLYADNYVVVTKEAKVFDSPSNKGYATKNQNDQDVVLSEGMAFKLIDKKPGWNVIEYYPGLRGLVMDTMVTSDNATKISAAGNYSLKNSAGDSVSISLDGETWKASVNGMEFKGQKFGNVVIFFDANGNQAYSLTNISGKPVVYSYSNELTKFF